MSYRFRQKEKIPAGIRRIGREQISAALIGFSRNDNIHLSIHQARKRLKCIRSLLHLIRPGLDPAIFKTEDRRYRNIGRKMSSARDAQVLLETLTQLENRFGISNTSTLRSWLHDRHQQAELKLDKQLLREVENDLHAGKKQFSKLGLKQIGFIQMAQGAKITYKQGRAAFLQASHTQDGEHYHDWRKDAQRHWRHMQLLRPCWPEMIDTRARYAHRLAQLLGDDHDLEVFAQLVNKHQGEFKDDLDLENLLSSTRKAQKDLRKSSNTHAHLLYAEKPSHFQLRLTAYWEASVGL